MSRPVSLPRVLCVDDDANVLAALRRQLRHRYDVVLAQGGAAGLERLRDAGPFPVVVCDLHMPGVDGRAFLREARAVAPRTLAILMTGSATDDDVAVAGLEELLFRKLRKPCLPDALWAALDAAIARYEAVA